MAKRKNGKRKPADQLSLMARKPCRGFTLTELLVVFFIVILLGTLVWMGVSKVLRNRKVARVKVELAAIELAIEAYKQKFGHYPPDNPNDTEHNQLFYELRGTLLEQPVGPSPPWPIYPNRPTWPVSVQDWPSAYHAGNLPDQNPIELNRVHPLFGGKLLNSAVVPPETYASSDKTKREARPTGGKHTNELGKFLLTRKGGDKQVFRPSDLAKFKVYNFLPTWKNKQFVTIRPNPEDGNAWDYFTFLRVPAPAYTSTKRYHKDPAVNLWHYRSTSPKHNPEKYDLWAEFTTGDGEKMIIGNWEEK